jgi:hypothetical protein
MADQIVQLTLKNHTPSGCGKSWVAEINGMYDRTRASYSYLKNGYEKLSHYYLRDGKVYRIHEPKDATHAKEYWALVHGGELVEVEEPWVLSHARKLQAKQESEFWDDTGVDE